MGKHKMGRECPLEAHKGTTAADHHNMLQINHNLLCLISS